MRGYHIGKILLGTFYVLIFLFASYNLFLSASGLDEYGSVFLARALVGYAVMYYLKRLAKTIYEFELSIRDMLLIKHEYDD